MTPFSIVGRMSVQVVCILPTRFGKLNIDVVGTFTLMPCLTCVSDEETL